MKLFWKIAINLFMSLLSLAFLYPFYWMIVNSFRTQEQMLRSPLRWWPEEPTWEAYRSIGELGGVSLVSYVTNSLIVTIFATVAAVVMTAFGAYAIYRRPDLPLFGAISGIFLVSMMYPAVLLVIPVYILMFKIGLLGTYTGIILFLSVIPILFLMLLQFFRSIPTELIESAKIDGASELKVVLLVVFPVAKPILTTVFLIGFLLTWKQWLPVMTIATDPDHYTLPVALLSLNSELGVNLQSTMALSALTTVPIVVLFLLTQRRIISGLLAGAVKG